MAVVVPPQEQGIQWPYLVLGAMLLASAVGLFYWLWQSRHAHSRLSLISQSLDQKGGENPTSPPANSSPGARPD